MVADRPPQTLVAVAVAATLGLGALGAACGGGADEGSAPESGSQDPSTSKAGFDPSNFGDPLAGTNKWLPLKPGTQSTRQGFVDVGHRRLPHQVVTTVTDVTKEVDGVRTAVILDQDFDGGQIAEQAIDFVAEDKQGNVWYLGSYTEAYEGGQFVNVNDAWLAGVNGAKAGLLMQADPRTGTPRYTEATVPGDETPTSQVAKTGESQCVPFKCYEDVLVIEENGEEHKLYAPGVGQIKTEPLPSSDSQEVEDLINLTQLSPQGLAEISAEALKLDRNAQVEAADVFGHAPAANRS